MGNVQAVKQQAPPAPPAPPASRMQLARVVRGKQDAPDRVLIFGVEGVGKSSWAASAPSPIFIPAEDGTSQLDVARFPAPTGWQEVLDAIESLRTEPHAYKTVVFDTMDALEPMLWAFICDRDKRSSIEAYGYGKGYVAALDEWRVFLSAIEQLRRERGMGVVFIAHSLIKVFKNPEGEDFDRYELKLNARAGGLAKEWCDSVLFAHWETFADKKGDGKAKGLSTGARIVSTQRTAAWDAKNRYALPEMLPLNYDDYARAKVDRAPRSTLELQLAITAKLGELGDAEVTAKVTALVELANGDASELSKIDNRLTATLSARKGA